MTATLTKWYEEHGRHEIFAGNKAVPLTTRRALLVLERRSGGQGPADRPRRAGHRQERARREAARRRKKEKDPKHHAEMERLYRQHVLKDPKPRVSR